MRGIVQPRPFAAVVQFDAASLTIFRISRKMLVVDVFRQCDQAIEQLASFRPREAVGVEVLRPPRRPRRDRWAVHECVRGAERIDGVERAVVEEFRHSYDRQLLCGGSIDQCFACSRLGGAQRHLLRVLVVSGGQNPRMVLPAGTGRAVSESRSGVSLNLEVSEQKG